MLEVVEIIRQMKQGATAPFLCRANDGKNYVVKGARATAEGCAKEWIAGRLGSHFGLPIPNFALISIDEDLVTYDSHLQFELGHGIAFASEEIVMLQEVTFNDIESLDERVLRDLFFFDYWINNDDRCLTERGGNPNLFIDHASNEVIVLDHNLSFDPQFEAVSFKETHLSGKIWGEHYDLFDKGDYTKRIEETLDCFADIKSHIPHEWLDLIPNSDDFLMRIEVTLRAYTNDQFWEGLEL